jgi:hypothetical protein
MLFRIGTCTDGALRVLTPRVHTRNRAFITRAYETRPRPRPVPLRSHCRRSPGISAVVSSASRSGSLARACSVYCGKIMESFTQTGRCMSNPSRVTPPIMFGWHLLRDQIVMISIQGIR